MKLFSVRTATDSAAKLTLRTGLAVGILGLVLAPAAMAQRGGGGDHGDHGGGGGYQGSRGGGGSYQGSRGGVDHNLSRGGSSGSFGREGGSSHTASRPSYDYGRRGADLGYLVNRGGSPSIHDAGRYRTGYYHYNPGWHDRDFAYRGYVWDPYAFHAYLSPFCYYPFLPAYIGLDGLVVYGHIGRFFIGAEFAYYPWTYSGSYDSGYNSGYNDGYRAGNRDSDRAPELDRAVDEIVNAFQQQDYRALDLLVGRKSHIDIFQDDQYSYSLESDAFYDLMRDNVKTAKTTKYEILNVRRYKDNAFVVARHDFVDPWGKDDFVYHTYKIHFTGRDAQIVEFGTSKNEPRY